MGSGSSKNSESSRPSSYNRPKREDSSYDAEEMKPIRNWQGDVIGYVPLSEVEKVKRKQILDEGQHPADVLSSDGESHGSSRSSDRERDEEDQVKVEIHDEDDVDFRSENLKPDDARDSRRPSADSDRSRLSTAYSAMSTPRSARSRKSVFSVLTSASSGRGHSAASTKTSINRGPDSPYRAISRISHRRASLLSRQGSASSTKTKLSCGMESPPRSPSSLSAQRSLSPGYRPKENDRSPSRLSVKEPSKNHSRRRDSTSSTKKKDSRDRSKGRSSRSPPSRKSSPVEKSRLSAYSAISSHSRKSSVDSTSVYEQMRRERGPKPKPKPKPPRFKTYTPVHKYPSPKPSLIPAPIPKSTNLVSELNDAFRGYGTNELAVIRILGTHSYEQRMEIKRDYKARYLKDLPTALKNELGGHFLELCLLLVQDHFTFTEETIKLFLETESRHLALLGLLARASSNRLQTVKSRFRELHNIKLDAEIDKYTHGAVRDVLHAIFSGERESGRARDFEAAQKDAVELARSFADNEAMIFQLHLSYLISNRNVNQIREVCEAFRQISEPQCEIAQAALEMLGAKESLPYNAYLEACDDSSCFFAGCLHHSFEGIGTDDATLMRIFVSRAEIDLHDIADAYEEMFERTLHSAIRSETSGDYCKLLLKLLDA